MNEFINNANKRMINLIRDLSKDAKISIDKASGEEASRIALLLMYYKIVIQGCIGFEENVNGYIKAIKDCSMDETDIGLVLDKYCGDIPFSINIGDIEFDENPPINMEVKDIKNSKDIELDENPKIDIDVKDIKRKNDIEFDENPRIDMDVKKVRQSGDIEFDENPLIDIDVKEVFSDLDIILDENPYIDMDVKDVKGPNDIELDTNPKLNIDVKDVKGDRDIEFEKNPKINLDIKDVKSSRDIELEKNPKIDMEVKKISNEEKESKSDLFGSLKFNVKENSKQFVFNADEFDKQVKAEREAKRKRRENEK